VPSTTTVFFSTKLILGTVQASGFSPKQEVRA
jgi:hypothetical protein